MHTNRRRILCEPMSVSYPSLPLAHSRGTGQWNGSCSDGGQEMGELTLALPVPLWWWCGGVTGKYGSQKPVSRFRMPGMRSRVARQPAVARGSEVNRYSMPEEGHPTYGKPCEVSSRSVVLREGSCRLGSTPRRISAPARDSLPIMPTD